MQMKYVVPRSRECLKSAICFCPAAARPCCSMRKLSATSTQFNLSRPQWVLTHPEGKQLNFTHNPLHHVSPDPVPSPSKPSWKTSKPLRIFGMTLAISMFVCYLIYEALAVEIGALYRVAQFKTDDLPPYGASSTWRQRQTNSCTLCASLPLHGEKVSRSTKPGWMPLCRTSLSCGLNMPADFICVSQIQRTKALLGDDQG